MRKLKPKTRARIKRATKRLGIDATRIDVVDPVEGTTLTLYVATVHGKRVFCTAPAGDHVFTLAKYTSDADRVLGEIESHARVNRAALIQPYTFQRWARTLRDVIPGGKRS